MSDGILEKIEARLADLTFEVRVLRHAVDRMDKDLYLRLHATEDDDDPVSQRRVDKVIAFMEETGLDIAPDHGDMTHCEMVFDQFHALLAEAAGKFGTGDVSRALFDAAYPQNGEVND
jgi:hypothetical protein|tara:strand:- start:9051 stop:9404 length:354 start_codon:yes stop_codon:yes gene_type:complete